MAYPNIYTAVVFDLHKKVKQFLDRLNQDGQIDLDPQGYPYLIGVDRQGSNFIVKISRNNKLESFMLNPRKKSEPITSWDPNDGFERPAHNKQTVMVQTGNKNGGKERAKRTESYARIVEQMMRDG